MRVRLLLVFATLLITWNSCVFAEVSPTPAGNLFIPKGTQLAVEFADAVTSKATFIGETLVVTVLEDYVIDGVVVIEKGSNGFVSVVGKERSGSWGKSGWIIIQPQYLRTANGVKVPLAGQVERTGQGHGVIKPILLGAAGLSGLLKDVAGVGGAWVTMLVFPDFTPGKDTEFSAGMKIIVTTSENTDLGITSDGLLKAMTAELNRRGESGFVSSTQAGTPLNFTGTWMTRKGKIALYQNRKNTSVTGKFMDTGGFLKGTVQGNRLIGRWMEDPEGRNDEKGDFEIVLSNNGSNVMVLWKRDYAPNWYQDHFAAKISPNP